MRSTILLLAASSCAHANWLRWSVNREPVWAAQETSYVTESDDSGWTPIPTPAPGVRSDSEVVLDLLKRQTSETEWTNSETCGWFSALSSSAMVCQKGFTCSTSDNAVACKSKTFGAFYTACLDYTAFLAGSCSSLNPQTGCCGLESLPACGTLVWTGTPERFMYKCFETASALTMLDVPRFVLDASRFSETHTTPSPTITGSSTATDGSAFPSDSTGGSNPGSGGSNSGSAGDSGSGGGDSGPGSTTNTSANNTPVIIGSVVGGVAGLLFLLLLLFFLRRKVKGKVGLSYTRNKHNHNNQKDNSTNEYHNTNTAAAAVKGRSSSGSEGMTVVPIPLQQQQQQQQQQQPQHNYYNQEQHHYHPQSQTQPQFQQQQQQQQQPPPQYQAPARGQQPVSMSYTVNGDTGHASQPSYSSSSGVPPQFVVGGIVPVSHQSSDRQQYQQPQPQPQPQPQQQGGPSQLQPVNHIHVYYAQPAQNPEQGASYPASQFPNPTSHTHTRSGASTPPDALGLYTQGPGYRQSF
ncbi:hypothetical protein E0Z10_g5268 [Xylaria hypoxylon]|uniref:Mid2 domain-containing protein n=1 Tax=Xylaria hypoxylon TaxID=37992 RepID=A0A4Z0YHT4_9PEZI|nr:hypothetical protein E0Z10_g5268 [Xylaria hypoxylon]